MNREFEGFSKVFSFTFKQHIKTKAYKSTLVVVLLILFLLPAVIMPISEIFSDDDSEPVSGTVEVDDWFVVNLTENADANLNALSFLFGGSEIHYYDNTEDAFEDSDEYGEKSLVLVADVGDDGGYKFEVLIPNGSEFEIEDAELASSILEYSASLIIMQMGGVSAEPTPELFAPILSQNAEDSGASNDEDVPMEAIREVFDAVLPYITIMFLYFMILFYGQGVANSVIMEKSSKLMDTFLLNVKTGGMLLGKVVSISLAGVMELAVWILGAVGGFATGTLLVKAINPDTSMGIVQFFDSLELFRGMFSLSSIILALVVLLIGFFMYCALASIGGAIAGKPEDLSSTNVIFTMALVVSFLLTINLGGANIDGAGGMTSTEPWVEWFPFTAILIMPGKILLGEVGTLQTISLIGILLAAALLIIYAAGRIYKMTALYKGKTLKIGEVIKAAFSKN